MTPLGKIIGGLTLLGVASCTKPEPKTLTIAVAANLKPAIEEWAARFEKTSSAQVIVVGGATGQLVQQMENGAAYDVILTANREFMDRLVKGQHVRAESVQVVAKGRLALAVNRASGLTVITLEELTRPEIKRIAMANPATAPYGTAAKQALEKLGLWETLQPKIVQAENVRQSLQYVQTGDCPVGLVALSEVKVPEVAWTLVDDRFHAPLGQVIGIAVRNRDAALSTAFCRQMLSAEGQALLQSYGFTSP
jgi:molybdate transport system substrate-binding protein